MQGESIAMFVETMHLTRAPMKDVTYKNHIQSMKVAAEKVFEQQLESQKAMIIGSFSPLLRPALRLCWGCIVQLGDWFLEALIMAMMSYLAHKTVEEAIEILANSLED